MPLIAEIKEVDGRIWVKLEPFISASGAIYIWTEEEMIAHDRALIAALEELTPCPTPSPTADDTN